MNSSARCTLAHERIDRTRILKGCGRGHQDVFVFILWKNNEPGFRKTGGYRGTRDAVIRRLQISAGIPAGI